MARIPVLGRLFLCVDSSLIPSRSSFASVYANGFGTGDRNEYIALFLSLSLVLIEGILHIITFCLRTESSYTECYSRVAGWESDSD
jgi:hypothetical protein